MINNIDFKQLTDCQDSALKLAIDESKQIILRAINKSLNNLEEPQNELFQKIVNKERRRLLDKRDRVEAEFEKMRPKFKSLIDELNEKLMNDNYNDSELS